MFGTILDLWQVSQVRFALNIFVLVRLPPLNRYSISQLLLFEYLPKWTRIIVERKVLLFCHFKSIYQVSCKKVYPFAANLVNIKPYQGSNKKISDWIVQFFLANLHYSVCVGAYCFLGYQLIIYLIDNWFICLIHC